MIRFVFMIVFALASLPLQAAPKNMPSASYRLGIFPYMAPRQTVELYGPVLANMRAALKHPVRLESAATFPDFSRALETRNYDIALIQPFDYPKAVEDKGYLPLARLDAPLITQLMVRDDSRFRKLADLRGSIIALPPEQSANARMALRALHDNKLIPGRDVEIRYFKSHDSCIQQVWIGEASACGTSKAPIQVFEQRMQARLRSIYDTPPIPHALFVVHPRIPADERTRLQQLITGWSRTEEGQAMMKKLGFPGFVVPKPAEYSVMRNYIPAIDVAGMASPSRKELVLGVFPYISARKLSDNFAPALLSLSKAAGNSVTLRSASSYENFSDDLTTAIYDIVVVQPFDYARATAQGYLPLAGMKDHLQGKFFVLNTSPYKQIGDFKGQTIAMPPFDSAQSRLARHAMMQAGLTPERDVKINYRVNHEACIQLVQNGEAAACITTELALPMLPIELTHNLRAVGLTEKIPGVLFMAHKRLSAKVRRQLQKQILGWKNSNDGRNILQSIHVGAFVPVNVDKYNNMPKFD